MAVLAPLFNDWACLDPFLTALSAQRDLPGPLDVFLVDDGSTEARPHTISTPVSLGAVEVLRLGTNVGHQRAIATGLVEVARRGCYDAVVVMDADGEDRPHDIGTLWRAHLADPGAIIVAQRGRRTEAIRFRFFYQLYRTLFRVLTGSRLDFGNFSLLPAEAVERLTLMPELWNHYPAAVMRSRVPLVRVPIDRGARYSGRSRMNFTALVNHGLSGIAAFVDATFARLLVFCAALMAMLFVVAAAAVALRMTTGTPVTGWLALAATAAFIAVFQLITALAILSFVTLSMRSSAVPPIRQTAPQYLAEVTVLRR